MHAIVASPKMSMTLVQFFAQDLLDKESNDFALLLREKVDTTLISVQSI